nr:glycosyltransferase family 4 protein [Nitrospirota bacterium]
MHCIARLDQGGSAQNTVLTALGHDRARFEPLVVAGHAGRWDAQGGDRATEANCRRLTEAGIRWVLLPTLTREINPLKDLATLWRLVALFRLERPAIVHTHTSKAGVLGRLAAWLADVPVVVHTPHGHVFYGHFGRAASRLFLWIERALARGTTGLIALTEAERDEHLVLGVGRAEQFSVVPSGIDLSRFRDVAGEGRRARPSWFGCPPEAIVIGSVGWLTEVKGHRFLIEAFAKLKPAHPSLHLVIVGSGGLRDAYLALADRLGVHGSVHLLGDRQDVPDCLAGMDLFVLPSLNEGMGRALIEAMAAGLPVVASRVGGVPAIVEERRTGLLVPAGDAGALASAVEELMQKPEWARELGVAASRSIGERFGAEAMVRAIESVYDKAGAAAGLQGMR